MSDHDFQRRRSLAAALIAAALTIAVPTGAANSQSSAATMQTSAVASAGIAPTAAVLDDAIRGFVSNSSSKEPLTIHVFFDTQCAFCTLFWRIHRPASDRARFVWVPIALLSEHSKVEGAAVLAASDPVAWMDEHAQRLRDRSPSMQVDPAVLVRHGADLQANTEFARRLGINFVPTLIVNRATPGAPEVYRGAVDESTLSRILAGPLTSATQADELDE